MHGYGNISQAASLCEESARGSRGSDERRGLWILSTYNFEDMRDNLVLWDATVAM